MKNLKKILSAVLTVAMVMTMLSSVVFGFNADTFIGDTTTAESSLGSLTRTIIGFITFAAWAIAVGMMIFIGIKYMLKGAGEKAEVKTTLLPYLIGAICVGAAGTIANFAMSLGQNA